MPPRPARIRVERGLHKRGDTWYASACPPGSRREVFRSLGRGFGIARARVLRDDTVAEIRAGGRTVSTLARRATLEAIATDWLEHKHRLVAAGKLAPRTVSDSYEPSIRLHVVPFFAGRRAAGITPEDLLDWHARQLELGASDWSIRARWTALTGVLSHAVRRGALAANPADLLDVGERPGAGESRQRFLDDDEMRELLAAAQSPRWRLLIAVMLFAGVRISEALGLVWDDVDFRERVIRVHHQLGRDGKRRKLKTSNGRRDVVMIDALAGELRRAQLAAPTPVAGRPVFSTLSGRPVSQRNATRAFRHVVERTTLRSVTPHSLRHTFVSVLVFQGRDPAFVADQVGHANPAITLRVYGHLFRGAKQKDAARDQLEAEYGWMLKGGSS